MLKIREVAYITVINISFMSQVCYDVPSSVIDIALTVNTQNNNASSDQLIKKFLGLLFLNDSQINGLEKATRIKHHLKFGRTSAKGG